MGNGQDGSYGANQYSAAVTTGQGQQDWPERISRVRAKGPRAPIPTCVFPTPAIRNIKLLNSDVECPKINKGEEGLELTGSNGARRTSESMESMMDHINPVDQAFSEPGSASLSDSEFSEPDRTRKRRHSSAKSYQMPGVTARRTGERKKVGRPVAYNGDPNSPALSESERRRIKRRIANRESARRVRHKRQEQMEDLHVKIEHLQSQNADLRSDALVRISENENLNRQLKEITGKYTAVVRTNEQMQLELQSLRSAMQIRMSMLEHALDKQDHELPQPGSLTQDERSVFGLAQVQCSSGPGYCAQPIFPFTFPSTDFKGSQSFQLDLDYLASLEDQKSLEFMRTSTQELASLRTGQGTNPQP